VKHSDFVRHETGHLLVSSFYRMGDITFAMDIEGVASLETEHGPRTPDEYFDMMLAGALGELYEGPEGLGLPQILSGSNWLSLLSTETARLDLEILGPMLTRRAVLMSATRVQMILDKIHTSSNPKALEALSTAVEQIGPGQSFTIKHKAKVVH